MEEDPNSNFDTSHSRQHKFLSDSKPVSCHKKKQKNHITSWITSKFSAGSIKGSIFELMVATIGSGVLVLPSAFAASGLTFSIIQLVTWAILGYWSTMLLSECGKISNKYSYPELAQATSGVYFQIFVKLIYFINNWGGCLVYTVLITNCIGTALGIYFPKLPYFLIDPSGYFWPPIYTTLVILPLSLNRDLSALRYTSLLCFIIICFLSTVIVYESTQVSNIQANFQKITNFVLPGIAVTFPNIIYSYSCHCNVLDVFHELQRPSLRRMSKILSRCMVLACIVYIIVGSFGYITFADNVEFLTCKGNILLSFRCKGESPPFPIIMALIMIGTSMTFSMPLGIKPCKDSLKELIFGSYVKSNEVRKLLLKEKEYVKKEDSKWMHVILVVIVVYSQMMCGMFVSKMSDAITLLGASAYPLINYNFPCYFYLKLDPRPWTTPKKLFIHFINILMLGLAIFSTYSFFTTSNQEPCPINCDSIS